MKKSRIAIVVGILIALGFGVYWQLGGFNPVEISLQARNNVKLLGLTYRGTPQDEGMVGTFQRIETLLKDNTQASLHTIYYTEPAGKLDTLQVFVGIEYVEAMADKSDLELKEIQCSQVVLAEMHAHRLVMPSPDNVKEQIENFAKQNGLPLQGIFIDKLLDHERIVVMAPVGERKEVMGHGQ